MKTERIPLITFFSLSRSNIYTLQGLRSAIPWGQAQFQQLLRSWQTEAQTEDVELEELRYRWMLYKSKLKDAESVKAQLKLQVLRVLLFSHSSS